MENGGRGMGGWQNPAWLLRDVSPADFTAICPSPVAKI
ncbi:hypothetical protein Agau_C201081 [Agrobacterium tumefaciens F2]|nr:hypothetical protein Agau_C201081 [Agrobacterium tumefaciens F2]